MAKTTKKPKATITRTQKRVAGVVDRIEGNIVVVVIRDPDNPDSTREIYIPRGRIKKIEKAIG